MPTKSVVEDKTFQWSGLVIGVLLLLGFGLVFGLKEASVKTVSDEPLAELQTSVLKTVSYEGQDGQSVYQLLVAGHQVEAQESDLGVMVTKIDGVGGDDNTYWLYYVNGEPGFVAADNQPTLTGEQIEWRYERF